MNNDFKRFWAWPDELEQSGILGINRRNVGFIFEHNPRHLYPQVDNKLKTKEICEACGIMVPETYGVLYEHSDCRRFLQMIGCKHVVAVSSGEEAIQAIRSQIPSLVLLDYFL
ncbi:MAG: hypothetical protein IH831_02710, partial [Planctomycetes bacterium]|nr:hypothetical protein [Planctomycetota bacterium]